MLQVTLALRGKKTRHYTVVLQIQLIVFLHKHKRATQAHGLNRSKSDALFTLNIRDLVYVWAIRTLWTR